MQLGVAIKLVVAAELLAAALGGQTTAQELNNHAVALFRDGDLTEAESYYRRALGEWRAAGDRGGEAATLGNLAVLCRVAGRDGEAAELFESAAAAFESAGAAESRQAATLLVNFAEFERRLGRVAKAEELACRAVAILELEAGGSEALASGLNVLAAVVLDAGRPSEAARLLERSRRVYMAVFGPGDPRTAPLLNSLAVAALQRREYGEAEAAAREAAAGWEGAYGRKHPKVAAALTNLGQAVRFQGRLEEAEGIYRRAIAILEQAPAGSSPDLAAVLANLADLEQSRGRFPRSVALFEQALAVLEAAGGAARPELATILQRLAEVRRAQGHFAESVRLYRRSLPLLLSAYGPGDRRVVEAEAGYQRLKQDSRVLVVE